MTCEIVIKWKENDRHSQWLLCFLLLIREAIGIDLAGDWQKTDWDDNSNDADCAGDDNDVDWH